MSCPLKMELLEASSDLGSCQSLPAAGMVSRLGLPGHWVPRACVSSHTCSVYPVASGAALPHPGSATVHFGERHLGPLGWATCSASAVFSFRPGPGPSPARSLASSKSPQGPQLAYLLNPCPRTQPSPVGDPSSIPWGPLPLPRYPAAPGPKLILPVWPLPSIFPSTDQESTTALIPATHNTGGSLPDLTNIHFPSPLPTPLDPEEPPFPALSGSSSTGNLAGNLTHLGLGGASQGEAVGPRHLACGGLGGQKWAAQIGAWGPLGSWGALEGSRDQAGYPPHCPLTGQAHLAHCTVAGLADSLASPELQTHHPWPACEVIPSLVPYLSS